MKKVEDRDHIDKWLETAWLQDIPNLDVAVEGIVDRMSGLTRRFKRSLNDVLAEHGLTFEEWDVLGALRRAGPPFRRSAGELAKFSELSSGAMTNRLDRLEKAGFVKRLPDPDDRRGVLIELTKAGGTAWLESTGADGPPLWYGPAWTPVLALVLVVLSLLVVVADIGARRTVRRALPELLRQVQE